MSFATEIAADLLPQVKVVLRAKNEVFDPEVTTLIASAVGDMLRCGVSRGVFRQDSEFYHEAIAAVHCYCKAHFGMDNPNAEMDFFAQSYRQHVIDLLNSAANTAAGAEDADVLG